MTDDTVQIWGLKTCDTCRKAVKALPEAQFRDIRAEPLTLAEIEMVLDAFGDKAINRASTTWRGLSDDARAATPAELLAAHPALMKRPVIRTGADWHLGCTPVVQKALGAA